MYYFSPLVFSGYCGAFRFRVWWCGEWVEVVSIETRHYSSPSLLKSVVINGTIFPERTDGGRQASHRERAARVRPLPAVESILAVPLGKSLRQVRASLSHLHSLCSS